MTDHLQALTEIVERQRVQEKALADLMAERDELRKQLEAPMPRPVITELVKKLKVWKEAWGTDATTVLLDAAVVEIEHLRAERDWARSEFERAMKALDGSITGVEWKWDGRRPGSLLVYHGSKSKSPSRQEKQRILKDVAGKGRITHRQKRRHK